MNMIVAVDRNWAIGKNNDLLVSIPSDKKFFRTVTTGKVVVMGRATLESLPGGRPLPQRVNIVLTADNNFFAPGCTVVRSPEQLLEELERYASDDIYVIGGASVYALLMPYCHYAYITKVEQRFPADRHLANLDQQPGWSLVSVSEEHQHEGLSYRFCRYQNDLSPEE